MQEIGRIEFVDRLEITQCHLTSKGSRQGVGIELRSLFVLLHFGITTQGQLTAGNGDIEVIGKIGLEGQKLQGFEVKVQVGLERLLCCRPGQLELAFLAQPETGFQLCRHGATAFQLAQGQRQIRKLKLDRFGPRLIGKAQFGVGHGQFPQFPGQRRRGFVLGAFLLLGRYCVRLFLWQQFEPVEFAITSNTGIHLRPAQGQPFKLETTRVQVGSKFFKIEFLERQQRHTGLFHEGEVVQRSRSGKTPGDQIGG